MKILILGASGMLGHKLLQQLAPKFDVQGTLRSTPHAYANHPVLGQTPLLGGVLAEDFDSIINALALARPEVVINAIGLIKQLPGAKDPLPSIALNSLFPQRLAKLCQASGVRMIHLSTDCVFSGKKGQYTEDDPTDAEDLYGRTKLLGEVVLPNCLTLRTSIIGRELATTSGLIEWFLSQRKGGGGQTVNGYAKAIYSGFTTLALADIISHVLSDHPSLSGLWQVSSEPISKFDLLQLVNQQLKLGINIKRDETFICDRSLRSDRFRRATGYVPPSWPAMIQALAADPTPYDLIRKER